MKRNFLISFVVYLLTSFGFPVFAQVPKDLILKLEKDETKKLERAAKDFEKANQLYDRGVQVFKTLPKSDSLLKYDKDYQKKYEDALEYIKKGSQLYSEASLTYYSIYKAGGDKFWEEQEKAGHYAIGLEKAKYLESLAHKAFKKAQMNRNLVSETFVFEEAINYLNQANHNEIVAIRDQGRALQIYQDFPVEYEYGWEDDVDIKEVIAKKEAERQARNEKLFGAKQPKKESEPISMPREEEKPEDPYIGEIIYRVQIAAAREPIEQDYIKTIYEGSKTVMEKQEDKWYKYQIGKYYSFRDAVDELKACNVEKAFIVVYQDGNRISVQQARSLAP